MYDIGLHKYNWSKKMSSSIIKLANTQSKMNAQPKPRAPKSEPVATNVADYIVTAQKLGHEVAEGFILNARLGVIADSLNTVCAEFKTKNITIGRKGVCPIADAVSDAISEEYSTRGQQLGARVLSNILVCLRKSVQVGYWLGYNPSDADAYLQKALDEPSAKSLTELKAKSGSAGRGAKEKDSKPKAEPKPRGLDSILLSLFAHQDIQSLETKMSRKAWQELKQASIAIGLKAEDFK
jgi:hypothetical protein